MLGLPLQYLTRTPHIQAHSTLMLNQISSCNSHARPATRNSSTDYRSPAEHAHSHFFQYFSCTASPCAMYPTSTGRPRSKRCHTFQFRACCRRKGRRAPRITPCSPPIHSPRSDGDIVRRFILRGSVWISLYPSRSSFTGRSPAVCIRRESGGGEEQKSARSSTAAESLQINLSGTLSIGVVKKVRATAS